MAKFVDLINELISAIASCLRKPADLLHLCIAERRSYGMISRLLYENIVLHHLDYPTHEQQSLVSNLHSLCRLLREQQQIGKSKNGQSFDFGRDCRSLAINMHNSVGISTTNVLDIFSFLPFLRYLSLNTFKVDLFRRSKSRPKPKRAI